ncbi:type III-B CRISPR module RAMP protein Cmr1 [Desulfobulbus sp. US4]|nr:type III-B CRISPR module RAMP protein Cmr1 [Desulfobulbus sp. US4]
MEKIEATFRIVTPMFMGGAEPADTHAELRAPSIKGVLRFWYRAIFPNQDAQDEARIFGGTDKSAGQAKIILSLSERKINQGEKGDKRWAGHDCKIPYLGYGIMDRLPTGATFIKNGHEREEKKMMTTRQYIRENGTFKLTVLFRPPVTEKDAACYSADVEKVKRAFWAMVMFGAFGARSRKGFGSIAADTVNGLDKLPSLQPENLNELEKSIAKFWKGIHPFKSALPGQPAEYSCFSTDTRCIITGQKLSAMDSLEWLAETLVSLRSYKSSNKLQFAQDDHDIMRDFIDRGDVPPNPPFRTAFGLPHNYFFTSIKGANKGGVDLMDGKKKGRRASPLLFKIHQFPNRQACTLAVFLPARLIPQGDKVLLSGGCYKGTCRYEQRLSLPDDFTPVNLLLDTLRKNGKGREITR